MEGNPEELNGTVVGEGPLKKVFNEMDNTGRLRFETVKGVPDDEAFKQGTAGIAVFQLDHSV